jgi:molybdopterin biosynthesis enzyme
MDGYAVRAGDTTGAGPEAPVGLAVVGELPAGRAPSRTVGEGEAIRIMTGAPMPDGADAIVMVEYTQRDGDTVRVMHAARSGDHVRPAGGDLAAGDSVFAAGTVLGPAHIGVLASLGVQEVVVVPVGFLCDHVEVLYDLDIEAQSQARALGLRMVRVPTVGSHPLFIDMLGEVVERIIHELAV